jgi:HK97 family phage prohead protease
VSLSHEFRNVDFRDAEIKGMNFRGYAAVFDTPWSDRLFAATGYVEKVARGVFRKALQSTEDVPLLIEHNRHQMLATTKSGNLRLREDGKGLVTEARLPDNYLGQYVREMIDRGDIRGMSYGIALDPKKDSIVAQNQGRYERTIANVQQLLDVSITWEPAYLQTSVELRSAGFVATPLQELLDGTEVQIEDGGKGEPPDEAWWDPTEDPSDKTAQPATPRKWWESYADELEREV